MTDLQAPTASSQVVKPQNPTTTTSVTPTMTTTTATTTTTMTSNSTPVDDRESTTLSQLKAIATLNANNNTEAPKTTKRKYNRRPVEYEGVKKSKALATVLKTATDAVRSKQDEKLPTNKSVRVAASAPVTAPKGTRVARKPDLSKKERDQLAKEKKERKEQERRMKKEAAAKKKEAKMLEKIALKAMKARTDTEPKRPPARRKPNHNQPLVRTWEEHAERVSKVPISDMLLLMQCFWELHEQRMNGASGGTINSSSVTAGETPPVEQADQTSGAKNAAQGTNVVATPHTSNVETTAMTTPSLPSSQPNGASTATTEPGAADMAPVVALYNKRRLDKSQKLDVALASQIWRFMVLGRPNMPVTDDAVSKQWESEYATKLCLNTHAHDPFSEFFKGDGWMRGQTYFAKRQEAGAATVAHEATVLRLQGIGSGNKAAAASVPEGGGAGGEATSGEPPAASSTQTEAGSNVPQTEGKFTNMNIALDTLGMVPPALGSPLHNGLLPVILTPPLCTTSPTNAGSVVTSGTGSSAVGAVSMSTSNGSSAECKITAAQVVAIPGFALWAHENKQKEIEGMLEEIKKERDKAIANNAENEGEIRKVAQTKANDFQVELYKVFEALPVPEKLKYILRS